MDDSAVRIHRGPVTAADGSPLGVVGIGRDISARESRQQALEQQNKRRGLPLIRPPDTRWTLLRFRSHSRVEHDSDYLDAVKEYGRIGQLIETSSLAQNGETRSTRAGAAPDIVERAANCRDRRHDTGTTDLDRGAGGPKPAPATRRNLIRNSAEPDRRHTPRDKTTPTTACDDLSLTVAETSR